MLIAKRLKKMVLYGLTFVERCVNLEINIFSPNMLDLLRFLKNYIVFMRNAGYFRYLSDQ